MPTPMTSPHDPADWPPRSCGDALGIDGQALLPFLDERCNCVCQLLQLIIIHSCLHLPDELSDHRFGLNQAL
jgi:hypothetical protein